jgi:triphosphoribosyl-dephospho-CoA synthase
MDAIDAERETGSASVQRAFVDACLLDVLALKPGNVGVHGAGHGMQALDFLRSARAAAPAIAAEKASVGERIHAAIAATRAAAGVNTNLGIVLLAAPLA